MGQLITRFTGGIEKTDINLDYQTYGIEGESDYAIDGNGEYDYDYDDMEEKSNRPSAQRITRKKVICWYTIDYPLKHSQKQRSEESAVSVWSFSLLPC